MFYIFIDIKVKSYISIAEFRFQRKKKDILYKTYLVTLK